MVGTTPLQVGGVVRSRSDANADTDADADANADEEGEAREGGDVVEDKELIGRGGYDTVDAAGRHSRGGGSEGRCREAEKASAEDRGGTLEGQGEG